MLHLPILRAGEPYRSLTVNTLHDVTTGEPVVEVSQANAGLIARDLDGAAEQQAALEQHSVAELVGWAKKAAELYLTAELPISDQLQGPEDYIRHLSSTTGLPHTHCRANMSKTHYVLDEMATVLAGLSRSLDLTALDRGWAEQSGQCVSFRRQADCLAAILPSNSPGVHSLWIPAVGLKVPVFLKPGRQEPWTPYRIAQALYAAGCPKEAFGFYPTDHGGSNQLLLGAGRSLLFGDQSTVGHWMTDHRVEIHGPGWSKVIVGDDLMDSVLDDSSGLFDLIESSIAANGGRSCINASGLWMPSEPAGKARQIAERLAERFAAIPAQPMDHPDARLAAFSDPRVATAISNYIDAQLAIDGAEDLTARYRPEGRVAEIGNLRFLLPTVIWCDNPNHPLARAEFLFPFVSVAAVPQSEILDRMGSSLVVSVLSENPALHHQALVSPNAERLNLGRVPTTQVVWDQPHEGNLFEHLYHRRALQGSNLAHIPLDGASRPVA